MSNVSPADAPYTHHMTAMRGQLAQALFEQPPDHAMTAFLHAGGIVMQQLSALERGMVAQQGTWRPLWESTFQPWVVGYCMGSAMAALEKYGAGRGPEATGAMVTLMQAVFLGGTFEEIQDWIANVTDDTEYAEGMEKAAADADGLEIRKMVPVSLIGWLGPRLGLDPQQ